MAIPNVFISHRWAYNDHYYNLISKFNRYNFRTLNYSVPQHDPFDVNHVSQIRKCLDEQVRQCNYFIIFANTAIANSGWCKFEVDIASKYKKPILAVRPHGYLGSTPQFIQLADTEGGPVGFNTPSIIKRICSRLNHPLPFEIQYSL